MNIHCTYKDLLSPEKLSTAMTSNLKIRTKQSVVEETKRLLKYGFLTPVFVWKNGDTNEVIDGVGRVKAVEDINYALYRLGENDELVVGGGEKIDSIPVVYIDAESFEEAKKKVLLVNSMFGKIDKSVMDQYSKASGEPADFITCHSTFFEVNDYQPISTPAPPLEIDWLTGTYTPKIENLEVDTKDIERAEGKIKNVAKRDPKQTQEITCGNCGHVFSVGR